MKSLKVFLLLITFLPAIYAHAERITSFHSDIFLQKNDSVTIVETIEYDSEGEYHHGIYRNIPLDSFKGNPVEMSAVHVKSVTDESGQRYHYETSNAYAGGVKVRQVKIGNPNTTFQGKKTYVIRYTLTHALAKKSDDGKMAELYLDVTGNTWTLPLSFVSYTIYSDESSVSSVQRGECFEGMFGSSSACPLALNNNGGVLVQGNSTHSFAPGDGLTVKVPLVFTSSPFPGDLLIFLEVYGPYIVVALLFVLLFAGIFFLYIKYGKDPETTNPVIPEYDAPEGLTPLQASFILKERITGESIIAELLYQGKEGNLVIEEVEKKSFLWSNTDYRIDLKRAPLFDSSQQLLSAFLVNRGRNLFAKKEASQNSFFMSEVIITPEERSSMARSLYQEMMDHGYYDFILLQKLAQKFSFKHGSVNGATRDIGAEIGKFIFKSVITVFIFMMSFSGVIVFLGERVVEYLFLFFFSVIASVVLLSKILNRRTELGVNTKKQLEGLKIYIDAAEDDLINFENAPAKTPTVYMKLLPWAVFFGLEKKWSKKFENLTITENDAPYFHSSSFAHGMSIGAFASSVSSFQSVSAQTAASASSSGSSGGSSGGGGGGGGGGSW